MSTDRASTLLADMLRHAEAVVRLVGTGGLADADRFAASLFYLIAIGEAASRLGQPFHDRHPGLPWRAMIAQRNLIAHGYDIVSRERIERLAVQDLPQLITQIRCLLDTQNPPSSEPKP